MLSDYSVSDTDEENSVPWAYIYLYSNKVGEKDKNEIVPASKISKFDYNLYCDKPSAYKNVPMKYKPGGTEKNRQCVIHVVNETKAELEHFVQSQIEKCRRFPKPNIKENLSNLSIDSRVNAGHDRNMESSESGSEATLPVSPEKVKYTKRKRIELMGSDSSETNAVKSKNSKVDAKKKRKQQALAKKKSSRKVDEVIVGKYVAASKPPENTYSHEGDGNVQTNRQPFTVSTSQGYTHRHEDEGNFEPPENHVMSSPPPVTIATLQLEMQDMERRHSAAIRAYKMQLDMKSQQLKELQEKQITVDNDLIGGEADVKTVLADYDKKFHRNFILHDEAHAKEIVEGENNFVILRKGVKCKQKAYMDAFMQKNPSQFVIMLSVGIYGREDLSNRCRRQQKDTKDKKPLDDTITQVINEEFYHFLRMKGHTLSQIEDNLNKVNNYHRHAITSSISSMKHDKKKKEDEQAERTLELEEQSRRNPLLNESIDNTS